MDLQGVWFLTAIRTRRSGWAVLLDAQTFGHGPSDGLQQRLAPPKGRNHVRRSSPSGGNSDGKEAPVIEMVKQFDFRAGLRRRGLGQSIVKRPSLRFSGYASSLGMACSQTRLTLAPGTRLLTRWLRGQARLPASTSPSGRLAAGTAAWLLRLKRAKMVDIQRLPLCRAPGGDVVGAAACCRKGAQAVPARSPRQKPQASPRCSVTGSRGASTA